MSEIDEAIRAHVPFTTAVADKFLLAANKNPDDALLRAVGTLAQIIYITAHGDNRKQTLSTVDGMLQYYLRLLDRVNGRQPGAA